MLPPSWCPTRPGRQGQHRSHRLRGPAGRQALPGRFRTEPDPAAGQRPDDPGFEDGILGHKGGEEFEINVTFPVRYHVKDLAGKPVVFKIKLIDVCVRQLPALNSDFAKKVGKVDTMEAFREQVRKQLHDGKHASA